MDSVWSALGMSSPQGAKADEETDEAEEVKTIAQKNAESVLVNLNNNMNIFFDTLELNEDAAQVDYVLLLRGLCHNSTVRYLTITSKFLAAFNADEVRILLEIVGGMPRLETLTVHFCHQFTLQPATIANVLKRTSNLRELNFHNMHLSGDDYDMEPLGEAFEALTSLKRISLIELGLDEGGDEFEPVSLEHVVSSLSSLPALEDVEITMGRKLIWDDDSLGALCDSPYLRILKLKNMALSHTSVSSMAAALEGNRHLKHLQLSDCGFDGDGWKAIASALPENTALQHLDLSQCATLDDDGCFAIGSFMEGNTGLKTLQLQHDESSQVTSKGVTSFMRMLEKNTTLECLELSFTASDDSGFKSVADALVRNKSLKRLYLENHAKAVSTKGVVAIGQALETENAGLENIALIFDGADSDGVLALAKAVEKSSTLKHFTFNRAEYRSYKPFAN